MNKVKVLQFSSFCGIKVLLCYGSFKKIRVSSPVLFYGFRVILIVSGCSQVSMETSSSGF